MRYNTGCVYKLITELPLAFIQDNVIKVQNGCDLLRFGFFFDLSSRRRASFASTPLTYDRLVATMTCVPLASSLRLHTWLNTYSHCNRICQTHN